MEHQLHRGHRLRLLRLRPQAELADRQRLLQPHGGRRLRGRRPGHRRGGLRHLRRSGWAVYGGTSASAPIVAGVYALAGTPGSGDYPAKYPYSHTGNLYDVTSGSNGSCSTSYFCTARTGYDGPTGWGTPNGTAAFTAGTTTGNTVTVTNPGSQSTATGGSASLQIQASDSAGASLTYSATGLPPACPSTAPPA